MPQTTSASYSIGNSRQSSRSNSFNRRNSGEFENQQNNIKERLRLLNEAKLLKQKQLANRPKLAILFNPDTYTSDSLVFMNFIKDDTSASRFSIINYTNLANTLEEQYNLGFRFFASPTIGSFELYTYCIPFCKKYPDALLFTTYSTQYFEDGVLPFNIIRSSVNDKDMANYIVNNLLYNLNTLTKESVPLYYEPISNNNNLPIFEKIVYIYTEKDANGNPDTYSEGYGEQLKNEVNLQNDDILIELFKIQDDNFILPQEVKTLLSENPVSGINFNSSDKTMFILNSYSPEKILQLFDEEYMYDNYFIFGHSFSRQHYTSNYKFNYAICPVGNYSFEGYKICGVLPIDNGYYLSPFLYSIMDVILKLLPYYSQSYYKNIKLSLIEFNTLFIEEMKKIKLLVDDNYWYERKIFTYYIGTKEDDFTNAQYNETVFFKYKFNPDLSGPITRASFIYNFDNTYLLPFNSKIHSPIINDSNSFFNLKITSRIIKNITEVTIIFELNNNKLLGNDGLTFKNVIDYYKNSSITISEFSGIPLSKAGEQFANLSNLKIIANDYPTIFPDTSLKKAFYNCIIFNSNISNWNTSNVTNMDSMFENATEFNNGFSPLNWNCNSLTSAVNFGLNSALYGKNGKYTINSGNGVRNDELTSIETPTKTLIKSNSSFPLQSGIFQFSFPSNTETFDKNMIPIINSTSFLMLRRTINYYVDTREIMVTINYSYKNILGDDGLSFKNVLNYYTNMSASILQFGGIPLSKGGHYFSNLYNIVILAKDTPSSLQNISLNTKSIEIPYQEISETDNTLSSSQKGWETVYSSKTVELDESKFFSAKEVGQYDIVEFYICGGGGSGGCGGADRNHDGTDGTGGGGGEYRYKKFLKSDPGENTIFNKGVKVELGDGGESQSGTKRNDDRNGLNGNDGGTTKVLLNWEQKNGWYRRVLFFANGGKGGNGGHDDENPSPIIPEERYDDTSTLINKGGQSGENGDVKNEAKSGYTLYHNDGKKYGNGGKGTSGKKYKPNGNSTGAGNRGYCKIIFSTANQMWVE